VHGDGLGYENCIMLMRDAGPSRKPFDWCLQKGRKNPVGKPREMEFLDINFTKDESFAPCYSQSLLLADLNFSGFKTP
jgi:hypothetical protein